MELDVIKGSFFWANYITGIAFDGKEYALPTIEAFTDTGTSCTYIPSEYYEPIMAHVSEQVSLKEYAGANYVDCSERRKFPVIEFRFGSYWMELLPDDYIIDDSYTKSCFVCIFNDKSSEKIILGNSFLRGFYTTHDLNSNRFGFGAHATSTKANPREGDIPSEFLTK